jgi:hypothetical protein
LPTSPPNYGFAKTGFAFCALFEEGNTMNLFKHLARAAAELLTLPDPYPDPYEPPQITGTRQEGCNTVIEVKAMNYRDVERLTGGVSVAGKQIVHTRVGRNRWEVHTEDL